MAEKKTYSEKLKDPRWQKKRFKILERDQWMCQNCGDKESTLHVHHRVYQPGREPWEIDDESLIALCESCHEGETVNMNEWIQELNYEIKKKFLSADVLDIVLAFQQLDIEARQSYKFTSALLYWFKTPELVQEMIDRYINRPKDPVDEDSFNDMPF